MNKLDMNFHFSEKYVLPLFALFIAVATIYFLGYEIGTSDSIEFIPYSLTFVDRTLFPFDPFVQYHLATPFNERMFFASSVGLITQGHEFLIFVLHVIVTYFMSWGVLRFASIWIKSNFLSVFASLLIIIGCYGWTLSCSEAYAGVFESSNITFALQIWVLIFLLSKNWWQAAFLTTLSVLIQPQLGLNFLLIYIPVALSENLAQEKDLHLNYWLSIAICSVLSIGYLILLLLGQQKSADLLTHGEFMKIAYSFRLPHHVYPEYFPKSGILVTLFCGIISLVYFRYRYLPIFFMALVVLLGGAVYLLSLQLDFFWGISTWWMRMSIWLRLLGIIAGLAFFQQIMASFFPKLKMAFFSLMTLVLIILIFSKSTVSLKYDFITPKTYDSERDICQKINGIVPSSSVIIHPFQFTGVQYFSRVSTFVTFKAIPKRDDYLKLWYDRIVEVYKVDTNRAEKGFDLIQPANENFSKLSEQELLHFKKQGITHIITFSRINYPAFRKIAYNTDYAVYEL